MATTDLVIRSNRIGPVVFLSGESTSVPADAAINELFRLPVGFGDLWIDYIEAGISGLSGAYVAPAPAFDGISLPVYSSDVATIVDILGDKRFVNVSTQSARPVLNISIEYYRRTVLKQGELIAVATPILAGAGVTATVTFRVRGLRTKND